MLTDSETSFSQRANNVFVQWFGGRLIVLAFIACSALFIAFPHLDIAVAREFVLPSGEFVLAHHPIVLKIHHFISASARVLTITLAALLLLGLGARFGHVFAWAAARRRAVLYVFAVLALGPGLVVNALLKDQFGRARPAQVTELGGERVFSRAFVISDQCHRNCAFVSGHAAYAALPLVGWFIARRRRARIAWLSLGLGLGSVVGLVRMAMGGHFLSDVVIAIFITWFAASICARVLLPKVIEDPQA
ncbi:MAG TPA: phosphatase PAP2 family protein [Burkholderiaceae bacterium]|nr:phosphatase PAP2 family protein [Burkholderiaceae bacterium]